MKAHAQQPEEGAKAYAAFLIYRDLPLADRSFIAVSRQCKKAVTLIRRWAKRWRWVERLKAWNDEAAARESAALDDAARAKAGEWAARQQEVRERMWNVGQKLLAKAEGMLDFPLAKKEVKAGPGGEQTHIHPARWDLASAARLAAVGNDLCALATGMATNKTEISGPDNSPVVAQVGQVVIELPDNKRENTGAKG